MADTTSVVLRPGHAFNGVKVFSATIFAERSRLGDRITDWIAANPALVLVEIAVRQSSDYSFHCLAFTVFYWRSTSEE